MSLSTLPPETKEEKRKWIHSLWTFAISVAVVGPLALPLLWRNPHYTKSTKWFVSILVILFTLVLIYVAGNFTKRLWDQVEALQKGL